jgi:hypothetical protein
MPTLDDTLYVDWDTHDRLMASERAHIVMGSDGPELRFVHKDLKYPGSRIEVSPEVVGNSVHRKTWNDDQARYVFEFVSYI